MAKKTDNPEDYKGPRTVIRSKGTTCGWCMSEQHESCKHELAYYDKLWICNCKCNDNWIPQDVGTALEEKNDKRRRGRGKDSGAVDDDSGGKSVADDETTDGVSDNSDSETVQEPDDSE